MLGKATTPLKEPFDGAKTGNQMFIQQVTTAAAISGWNTTIMTIPTPTVAVPENTMHLLIQYGQVKLAHIEAHAILYHRTQANAALLRRRSLKKTLMFWVLTKKPSYKFGGIKNWLSNVPRHPSICRH